MYTHTPRLPDYPAGFKKPQMSSFFDEQAWRHKPQHKLDYGTGQALRINSAEGFIAYEAGALEWPRFDWVINKPDDRQRIYSKTGGVLEPMLLSDVKARALRTPAGDKPIKKNLEIVVGTRYGVVQHSYVVRHRPSGKLFPAGDKFTLLKPGAEPISDAVFLEAYDTPDNKAEWLVFSGLIDQAINIAQARAQMEDWDNAPPDRKHNRRLSARTYQVQYVDRLARAQQGYCEQVTQGAETGPTPRQRDTRVDWVFGEYERAASNTDLLCILWRLFLAEPHYQPLEQRVAQFKAQHRDFFLNRRKHTHLMWIEE